MTAPLPNRRILLADLAPAQIARLCNGCGSHSGPFRWIRPPQGHAVGPCNQHDVDYVQGFLTRWKADWLLLRAMLAQARDRRFWQRPGFIAKAVLYWVGVRLGGWASFHHGKPRTIEDINRLFPRVTLRVLEAAP